MKAAGLIIVGNEGRRVFDISDRTDAAKAG